MSVVASDMPSEGCVRARALLLGYSHWLLSNWSHFCPNHVQSRALPLTLLICNLEVQRVQRSNEDTAEDSRGISPGSVRVDVERWGRCSSAIYPYYTADRLLHVMCDTEKYRAKSDQRQTSFFSGDSVDFQAEPMKKYSLTHFYYGNNIM